LYDDSSNRATTCLPFLTSSPANTSSKDRHPKTKQHTPASGIRSALFVRYHATSLAFIRHKRRQALVRIPPNRNLISASICYLNSFLLKTGSGTRATGTYAVPRFESHFRRYSKTDTPKGVSVFEWRRRWDSNPRAGCPTNAFRVRPVMTSSILLRADFINVLCAPNFDTHNTASQLNNRVKSIIEILNICFFNPRFKQLLIFILLCARSQCRLDAVL
jgi:hypothetical protein